MPEFNCRSLGGNTLHIQGENMRYFILALSIALIINGCKKSSNPVGSETNSTLSVSQVQDSLQYTFAIPKAVFGIHDTLSATLTAFNQSAETDTLIYGVFFQWSLKNDSGRTLMGNPDIFLPIPIRRIILNSHQSDVFFVMDQAIIDTAGAPVIAGSYKLQVLFNSMSFTLDLSLQ
jgi:hypothetical protein